MIPAATPRFHRHDGRRTAIAIAACMFGAFAVAAVVESVLRVKLAYLDLAGVILTVVTAGIAYYFAWLFDRFTHDPRRRHRHLVVATVALLLVVFLWLLAVAALLTDLNVVGFVAALPFTGFALFVLRRIDRNEKEPWRLVLVALVWGGVVATNLAILFEAGYSQLVVAQLLPGPGQGLAESFSAAVFEEVPKGLAVVFLFLLSRHEFDDVVDGIVYGAAVGLGFNFVESLGYMAGHGLLGQLIVRQVYGLFTGHATYTALIGAGLGVARQLHGRLPRAAAILSGFLAAIGAHFTWDAVSFTNVFPSSHGAEELFVWLPLQVVTVDGPWVLAVIGLLLIGLRNEGRALETELAAEAASGSGAILPSEVNDLLHPAWRWSARMDALRRRGFGAYRRLARLQRTQLKLAIERWHRTRQEIEEQDAESHLRALAIQLH